MRLTFFLVGLLFSAHSFAGDTCLGIQKYGAHGYSYYQVFCGDMKESQQSHKTLDELKAGMKDYSKVIDYFGGSVVLFSNDEELANSDKLCLMSDWRVLTSGALFKALGSEATYANYSEIDCGYGVTKLTDDNDNQQLARFKEANGLGEDELVFELTPKVKHNNVYFRMKFGSEEEAYSILK